MKVTIVDDTVVQQGEQRTKYGKAVLKNLSIRLTDEYGEGWSVETLDKCRKFYRVFSRSGISSTMQTKLTREQNYKLTATGCQMILFPQKHWDEHLNLPFHGRITSS